MEKALQFILENLGILSPVVASIVGILIGAFLPPEMFRKLGLKVRMSGKIPPEILAQVAKRVDAFEKGLLAEDFRGDKSIIGNHQLSNNIKLLKKDLTRIDLGLKE